MMGRSPGRRRGSRVSWWWARGDGTGTRAGTRARGWLRSGDGDDAWLPSYEDVNLGGFRSVVQSGGGLVKGPNKPLRPRLTGYLGGSGAQRPELVVVMHSPGGVAESCRPSERRVSEAVGCVQGRLPGEPWNWAEANCVSSGN